MSSLFPTREAGAKRKVQVVDATDVRITIHPC